MADAKISDLAAAAAALATHEFEVNESSVSKKLTGAQIKAFMNSAPAWAGGSAAAGSWPTLGTGSLLTTPEAGALERDANCWYMTTDAGNRGVVAVRHFIRADATRTLPNDANENAIFNVPSNGRLTLETGCYLFEILLRITAMSATSGNALIDILGAGTAVCAAWLWETNAIDNTNPENIGASSSAWRITQDTPAAVATAATGTAMGFSGRGTFEVTTPGTLIPSIDLANAAAAVVAIGSFFSCERIGATNIAAAGQWD